MISQRNNSGEPILDPFRAENGANIFQVLPFGKVSKAAKAML